MKHIKNIPSNSSAVSELNSTAVHILDLREQPENLTTLAKWHHDEWQHLNPGQTLQDRVDQMQRFLDNDRIPSTYIAIDDQLLGSASIVTNDMEDRKDLSPWLASVYVSSANRCRGIGSTLIRHVMNKAKADNIKTLYLFTEDQTEYYQRLGWRCYEKANYRDHDVQIMCVDLDALP